MKRVFKTDQEVFFHASTGHGAWEAAVANLFSPGDLVLVIETGYFSLGFKELRRDARPQGRGRAAPTGARASTSRKLHERLAADKSHEIKAVLAVHNETATGMVLPIAEVRRAMDQAKHPALLLSDTISSLGSMEYKMDAWGIDVTIAGSQKGLMMPTGMAITGVSNKALEVSRKSKLPQVLLQLGADGRAQAAALHRHRAGPLLLRPAGVDQDDRGGDAGGRVRPPRPPRRSDPRRRARLGRQGGKGPSLYGQTEDRLSNSVTTVMMPEGHTSDAMRKVALERFNLSLGGGLGPLMGKVFRIGHLGDLNEPMLLGCLATTELAMKTAGVPFAAGGVDAAIDSLAS